VNRFVLFPPLPVLWITPAPVQCFVSGSSTPRFRCRLRHKLVPDYWMSFFRSIVFGWSFSPSFFLSFEQSSLWCFFFVPRSCLFTFRFVLADVLSSNPDVASALFLTFLFFSRRAGCIFKSFSVSPGLKDFGVLSSNFFSAPRK